MPYTAKQFSWIFDKVRQEMDDVNANTFTDDVLLVPLLKIYNELNVFLIETGAEIANIGPKELDLTSLEQYAPVGDWGNFPASVYESGDTTVTFWRWELPTDFLCFATNPNGTVNARFRKADGTIDSSRLIQYSPNQRDLQTSPRSTGESITVTKGIPQEIHVTSGVSESGSVKNVYQFAVFDTIPDPDEITDLIYYYYPSYHNQTVTNATNVPWGGLMNMVFWSELVFWCRHWKEFSVDLEMLMKDRIRKQAQEIMGLRILDERAATPSMWRGFPH